MPSVKPKSKKRRNGARCATAAQAVQRLQLEQKDYALALMRLYFARSANCRYPKVPRRLEDLELGLVFAPEA